MNKTQSRRGIAMVVCAPSGAGKSTILKSVLKDDSTLAFSVSCTTRPPRPTEKEGVDYHFLNHREFEKEIANENFIEYADVHGNYYGSLKSELLSNLNSGHDLILEIDIQGAEQIRQKNG